MSIKPATNDERLRFLIRLAESDLNLDERERDFVDHCRRENSVRWFSDGRARWADKLLMKYGLLLEGSPSAASPACVPGQCEFLVKDADKRTVRCGEPAVLMTRGRLNYCQTHADQVAAWAKRQGRPLTLYPYAP